MRLNRTWRWWIGAALLGSAALGTARATPQDGFTASTYVRGTFEEFDVVNQWVFSASEAPDAPTRQWLALQKTNGPSDVYVQNNTWQPGGTTGWHTHPGHSLIIVTEGTITAYDESCVPVQYSAGATIVDEGGDHAHVLRNETGAIARTVAIQIVPVGPGVMRRIDADAPPSCVGVR